MNPISHVVISIPARNEEALIAACLDSVQHAVAVARQTRPHLAVEIVVALDHCTDRTAEIAHGRQVHTADVDESGVGAARDAAIRTGLRLLDHPPLSRTWLACTDADTEVPSTWLVRQFMWAERGLDLVLGSVQPDSLADPRTRRIWHERHHLGEGHTNVHGANLGLRADRWLEVGGFGARSRDEDVVLVSTIQRLTPHWVATDSTRVVTSGRLTGRVAGGFADYLSDIVAQVR